jgi:glutamyl-tRNA synthetase
MTVITRFAPSPTGYLHIGSARTALFSWLYAKANGGKFLLRIEDTDRERSTQPAIDAILRSMRWLGMDWDGDEVYQFARASRHAEVAEQLVKDGKAYYCYTSSEELAAFRAANPHAKYRSSWRKGGTPPANIKPVIRLKAPITGETIVDDGVKGSVSVQNAEMDDMVLLRSDRTPTYMLAVVVDDHDMNVTHVIRGDDHFTNTFRQIQLYDACGWSKPHFSHIPMILGADGAKLSKRHGALGVEEYQKMGFLPEALNNYLLRLGWSHGDDEIISQQQAIEWFNLEHISNSPARFDMEKLRSVNAYYMRNMDEGDLANLVLSSCGLTAGSSLDAAVKPQHDGFKKLLPALKERAQTLVELSQSAAFLFEMQPLDEKAQKVLDEAGKAHLKAIAMKLENTEWEATKLEAAIKSYVTESGAKFPAVGMPIRAALTGTTNAPAVHEIMAALGKDETIARLKAVL